MLQRTLHLFLLAALAGVPSYAFGLEHQGPKPHLEIFESHADTHRQNLSATPEQPWENRTAGEWIASECFLVPRGGGSVARSCFPAGTTVWTDDGPLPIEEVRDGDWVRCADVTNYKWTYCEVRNRFEYPHDGELFSVSVNGETIEVTGTHPFWVTSGRELELRPVAADGSEDVLDEGGCWVEASELLVGDELVLVDGRRAFIDGISVRSVSLPVYNIEVDGLHTYAVGPDGVLVHNKAARVKTSFPDTKRLAKRFGIGRRDIHGIKGDILRDVPSDIMKSVGKNPDIGFTEAGNIVLKNRRTGLEVVTDLLEELYRP